jgi:hypothetical protein
MANCKCAQLVDAACSKCAWPESFTYAPNTARLCDCGELPLTAECDGTCDRLLMGIGPRTVSTGQFSYAEVRVTDPDTGGEKGQKLARFDLIPKDFLWAFAEHYGKGAEKYEERNWERGYKWSLSFAALQRHANTLEMGEDLDPETESHHALAIAWHAAALFCFYNRGIGTDDRVSFIDEATGEAAW